jgi:hypothetical protein
MTAPLSSPQALNAFYGNPKFQSSAGGIIRVDPVWADNNLVFIKPPYPMEWSWGGKCERIRVHKKVAQSLMAVLVQIGQEFDAKERALFQLDKCGGGFFARPVRGNMTTMSIHSWGAAIDIAPDNNGLGVKWNPEKGMMPKQVVEMFEKAGWTAGARWHRPDAMHFQYARVR